MNGLSDDRLLHVIRKGGAASNLSPEMPAWQGAFTDDQIRGLLGYLREFCPRNERPSGEHADASRRR